MDSALQHRRQRGPRQILVGHQDMASSRAYNGGLGAEPSAGSRGRAPVRGSGRDPPEAESLFAFGRLIVQYFAVFIRFSEDCMTLSEIEITW